MRKLEAESCPEDEVQNVTIFDWDDTLFCTSAYLPKNEADVKKFLKEDKAMLEKLDEAAFRVLTKSLQAKNS